MAITVRPATSFEDLREVIGPKRADASVCWCLTYRLPAKENKALQGESRGKRVAALLEQGPLGVLAYDGDEPVGWAAVAPRAETNFARSRTIQQPNPDAWSVWCIRVKPGHRGKGISHALLAGAVDHARSRGAAVIEGYPLDNRGQRINTTMAYVGTKALFSAAGFQEVETTDSVLDGFPRLLMHLHLASMR